MRVAVVCPYSLSRPGGVQGQVTGLAEALRRAGHSATVVAPDDRRPIGRHGDIYVAGRSINLSANGSVAPLALSPLAARRARRFTQTGGFDVVHLHEPLAPFLGYGCLLADRVPLVGTYHRAGDSGWYRAMAPLARWANGRLAARCAVSETAAATARHAMGGSYEVLFNGVDIERFASADPVATVGPTVLFLGRHERRKGLEVLLAAFASLDDSSATLWVAGDGLETNALRRRFPPSAHLKWLGVLGDDEVAQHLAAASVLCAPSLSGESFGMVLLEGMAARCVVVASDIPGYRAASGGHGLLVPPGDIDALREGLGASLAASAQQSGVASPQALAAAFVHAQHWGMDRLAQRYVDIYRAVVASRSHRDAK